jgi:GcrA cell cycle regulator
MSLWTETETTTLIRLWPTNSAAQIAARLARSRSAVCRKAQALHLNGTHKQLFEVPPRKPPAPARIPKSRERQMRSKPLPSIGAAAIDKHLAMQPCSILELDDNRCHWPIGNVTEVAMLFCGGAVASGQRYCLHHRRIASKG